MQVYNHLYTQPKSKEVDWSPLQPICQRNKDMSALKWVFCDLHVFTSLYLWTLGWKGKYLTTCVLCWHLQLLHPQCQLRDKLNALSKVSATYLEVVHKAILVLVQSGVSRETRPVSWETACLWQKRDLPREILVVSIMRRPSHINCWYLPMFCVFLNCKSVVLYCDSCMISFLTSWTRRKRKSKISREKCNNRYIRSYICLVFPPVQNSKYCYVI